MSDGLGEWTDHGSEPPLSPVRAALDSALSSVNVEASMRAAVRHALHARVTAVATTAIDDLLTDPMLAELRATADEAARDALYAPPADDTPSEPKLYYPSLLAFVTEYLTPLYRRAVTATHTTWCSQWWRHAEGITRLEALWCAWEHLRQDPNTGMSVWLRDHADHHMGVLLSADGPFKGCKPDTHTDRLAQLPTTDPPDGQVTLR
jgi:hypothetical protein